MSWSSMSAPRTEIHSHILPGIDDGARDLTALGRELVVGAMLQLNQWSLVGGHGPARRSC